MYLYFLITDIFKIDSKYYNGDDNNEPLCKIEKEDKNGNKISIENSILSMEIEDHNNAFNQNQRNLVQIYSISRIGSTEISK